MYTELIHTVFPQATLLQTRPLTGGISAQMVQVDLETPQGDVRTVIIRQPATAAQYQLLKTLEETQLPTPRPYLFTDTPPNLPDPVMVLSYIDGEMNFVPQNLNNYLAQYAKKLAAIHQITPATVDLSFLKMTKPCCAELDNKSTQLDSLFQVEKIKSILKGHQPWPQINPDALLHGDYWPGNILWLDGQLTAVIDWEDAHLGDPLMDLAKSRVETAAIFGVEAAESFTAFYKQEMLLDYVKLSYWDLCAALRFIRLADGDLNWICDFMREYGRDLTPAQLSKRLACFINKSFTTL